MNYKSSIAYWKAERLRETDKLLKKQRSKNPIKWLGASRLERHIAEIDLVIDRLRTTGPVLGYQGIELKPASEWAKV